MGITARCQRRIIHLAFGCALREVIHVNVSFSSLGRWRQERTNVEYDWRKIHLAPGYMWRERVEYAVIISRVRWKARLRIPWHSRPVSRDGFCDMRTSKNAYLAP